MIDGAVPVSREDQTRIASTEEAVDQGRVTVEDHDVSGAKVRRETALDDDPIAGPERGPHALAAHGDDDLAAIERESERGEAVHENVSPVQPSAAEALVNGGSKLHVFATASMTCSNSMAGAP